MYLHRLGHGPLVRPGTASRAYLTKTPPRTLLRRYNAGAACVDSHFYLFGGQLAADKIANDLWRLDTSTRAWTLLSDDTSSAPSQRFDMAMSSLSDGTLGVFGGQKLDSLPLGDFWRYIPPGWKGVGDTGGWTLMMPTSMTT